MARRQRPPSRSYPGWPSDDPLGLVQDELDERPRPEPNRPPRGRRPDEPRPARTYDDFPPKPDNRSERTWRLVKLFIQTAGQHGRVRVVSPWQLAEDLVVKINNDPAIVAFMKAHGEDLVEELFGRMVRIYWDRYVDGGTSRSGIVNGFLDDSWTDLWDQAKTQHATDEIQRLDAAGKLKAVPAPHWHSLANDVDYQAALQDLRVNELLVSKEQLESGSADRQS